MSECGHSDNIIQLHPLDEDPNEADEGKLNEGEEDHGEAEHDIEVHGCDPTTRAGAPDEAEGTTPFPFQVPFQVPK